MGVFRKPLSGHNNVVIEDPEFAVLDIFRVIVVAEGKQPVCLQPAKIGKMAILCPDDID
jgi:hypothetical protein